MSFLLSLEANTFDPFGLELDGDGTNGKVFKAMDHLGLLAPTIRGQEEKLVGQLKSLGSRKDPSARKRNCMATA